MTRDLDHLIFDLRALHDDISLISAELIVVAEWVRWKCRYGCRAYGKHFCCPPFVPDPEDTRKLLAGYRHALLVRIKVPPAQDAGRDQALGRVHDHKTRLQRLVYEMERRAFLSGYHKALAMASSPCHLCAACVAEEKLEKGEEVSPLDSSSCRHKDVMRPSLEACGIDVFGTLENAGWGTRVLEDYSQSLELFGLVLLE